MRTSSSQRPLAPPDVEDLARRRLEVLLAELSGDPRPHSPGPDERVGRTDDRADGAGSTPGGRHAFRTLPRSSVWGGWVEDRLPDSWRGRVRLGPAQVGAVALLLAMGVLLAAWSLTRTSEQLVPAVSAPVVSPVTEGADLSDVASQSPVAGAAPASQPVSDGATDVVVDVQGAVRHPGIVVLPPGARVVDALEEAGGYTGKKHLLRLLNLARPLVDGEQVLAGRSSGAATTVPGAQSPVAGEGQALVSLNTADQTALETLPGVGPVTAAAILQWRAENGAFTSVDQLIEVSGIGEKTLAQIAPFVTL